MRDCSGGARVLADAYDSGERIEETESESGTRSRCRGTG